MKGLFTLLSILLVFGCTSDDYSIEGSEGKTISSFKAIVEESPVTRSHFDTETQIIWDEGDVIHVVSDKQNDAVKFTHRQNGIFTGSPISYSKDIYAIYSPSGNTSIDWETKMADVVLSSSIVHNPKGFAGETYMVAKSENSQLLFKQTVGILKFSLTGTKHISKLTLTGNNGEVLAGEGKVDLAADNPFIQLNDGGSTSITMQTDVTLQEEEATCFYFQVPVISFTEGFTLTIEGEDVVTGESFKVEKSTLNQIDIVRNLIHSFRGMDVDERLQELFEDIEINPAYVSINWNKTQLISANSESGNYTFSMNNEAQNIQKGSVLTIMHDGNVDIVIVENITSNASTVSIATTPGYLNNIFANTSFTLSSGEDAATRSMTSSGNRVFYPVKTVYQDERGNIIELDEAQTRALSATAEKELWSFSYDDSGTILHQGEHHKVYLAEARVSADLNLALTLSFGGKDNKYQRFTSKPGGVKAELTGNLSTEQKLRWDVFGKYDFEGVPVIIKENVFKPIRRLFIVADVIPVYVECSGDLYMDADISYQYDGSFYAGFTDESTGSTYIEWDEGQGVSLGAEFESDFNVIYPTIEGKGELDWKMHVFPRINILVNRLSAANVDFKPYLRSELKGGFKEELLSSDNDYCAWSFDLYGGLDVAGGIDLNIYKEGQVFSSKDKNTAEFHLYKTPSDLKYLTGTKIKLGEKNTLTFSVYDSIPVLKKSIFTPLPQLLKFETKKGSFVSSKYGIAIDGKVSMDWAPAEDDDELYATLYNSDGNIIMQDTVKMDYDFIAYAVVKNDTLTFYNDNKIDQRAGIVYNNLSEKGWLNNSNVKIVVFDASFANYKLNDTSSFFYGLSELKSIIGIENLNTTMVENMSCMFYGCSSLMSLDLSSFDTSNVTDMGWMFMGCTSLQSLDVSEFNASNVTNMYAMFYNCSSLTSLELSGFNTSNVTNMSCMFNGCSSLTSLDLSGFNTSNVTNMSGMFRECSSLTSLDLSGLDTSSVKDMGCMFYVCSSLTSLDVSGWNTSNVTDMAYMFYGCSSLTSLDLSGWNTSNVTDMSYMFNGCSSLTSLDLSGCNTSNVTNMSYMFFRCSSLTSLDLSGLDTSSVKSMGGMFYVCSSLTSLDLRGWDTSNVMDMDWMFMGCSSLTSLDLRGWNTSNVTDMSHMFGNCRSLTNHNLSSFNTSNVTDMSYMFYGCSSLTSLDLSNFDTSNVTNMKQMFYFERPLQSSLTSLDLSGWNTSNVTDMSYMFHLCTSLTTIFAGNWRIADNSNYMFNACIMLKGGEGTGIGNNIYGYDENGEPLYYICPIDGSAAHIDGGKDNPGLFTGK
ncbi:MAG: DUF285 domain-containing protein [Bacteroidaceae bacterium]|nr:DUF285 domain-containing protein [Bacteroidaceae bacterium]